MKRLLTFFLVPILAGCSGSPEFSQRFEAERAMWKTNHEFQRLAIAPQLVTEDQWSAAADRFQSLGDTYGSVPASTDSGRVGDSVRATRSLAAQGYSRAAEIRMSLGDTAAALDLFSTIETRFSDLSGIAAGAALSKGKIYQAGGKPQKALDAYERVFQAVENAGDQTIPSAMLQVPVDMARLETGDRQVAAYARAESLYNSILKRKPGTVDALAAQSRLVDVATDQQQWPVTVSRLQALESMLNSMEDPPQPPAQVRMAIAQTQYRGLGDSEAAVATWNSLLRDYPKSEAAPQALLALSSQMAQAGDPQSALETLSRVSQEYPDDMISGPIAELARARLLEREDRWPEALQTYERLPIDYPLSEAALQSYIDIIGHYERAEDEAAEAQALKDADRELTDFINRDPGRDLVLAARQRRALVYLKQERNAEAYQALMTLAQTVGNSPQGLQFLVLAAQTSEKKLGKPEQAAGIYDEITRRYAGTETAKMAKAEAERIRNQK